MPAIITPNSNIVRSPNPIKKREDHSPRVILPEQVISKPIIKDPYFPLIKTHPAHA